MKCHRGDRCCLTRLEADLEPMLTWSSAFLPFPPAPYPPNPPSTPRQSLRVPQGRGQALYLSRGFRRWRDTPGRILYNIPPPIENLFIFGGRFVCVCVLRNQNTRASWVRIIRTSLWFQSAEQKIQWTKERENKQETPTEEGHWKNSIFFLISLFFKKKTKTKKQIHNLYHNIWKS